MKNIIILFLLNICFVALNDAHSKNKIVRVRLESCPGCKLNRLSEIKAFVYTDFPKYNNAIFKKIHGASPELLFLDDKDEVIERYFLENLSRQECNNLMRDKGFVQNNEEL